MPPSFLAVHGPRALFLAALLSATAACSPAPGPQDGPPDATPTAQVPPGPGTSPGATTPPTDPTAPTTQEPPTGQTPPGGGDASFAGTYTSPNCGARTYERKITINADGTFAAQDLVSPCPPGTQCVWSGIVNRQGTYTRAADAITLKVTGTAPTQGQPFPDKLVIDPATKSPAEQGSGALCVYRKTP